MRIEKQMSKQWTEENIETAVTAWFVLGKLATTLVLLT